MTVPAATALQICHWRLFRVLTLPYLSFWCCGPPQQATLSLSPLRPLPRRRIGRLRPVLGGLGAAVPAARRSEFAVGVRSSYPLCHTHPSGARGPPRQATLSSSPLRPLPRRRISRVRGGSRGGGRKVGDRRIRSASLPCHGRASRLEMTAAPGSGCRRRRTIAL